MMHLFPSRAAPGEMRFVHSHSASLIIGVLGTCGAILMWAFMPEGPVRLMFAATAGLTGLRFLASALRRFELVIELEARRWRRRTGFFFAPRTAAGSLDDLRGVALDLHHVSVGSGSTRRSIPTWTVSLDFSGPQWKEGTSLRIGLIQNNEPRAYRLLEHYARRFRVDAVDRTAIETSRRPWDALDRSPSPDDSPSARARPADYGADRRERAADRGQTAHSPYVAAAPTSAFASAMPPSGSGIEVTLADDDRPRILLPPHGASTGTVLGALFGILMIAVGAFFMIGGLGLGPLANGSGIQPVVVVVAGVFVWSGIAAIAAALSRGGSREWVIELPDSLRFGITRNGSDRSWTELPKRSIEEVSIRTPTEGGSRLYIMGVRVRTDPAAAAIIRVRTDTDLVRLGRRLTPEAREWLRDTIAASAGVAAG